MSMRAGALRVCVACCLSWPAARAFAQSGGQEGRWEVEAHAGVIRGAKSNGATTKMPAPGDTFITLNGRPSRYVSSWYFGDGTALFNQWVVAVAAALNLPSPQRITSLDSTLTGSAAAFSNTGDFGVRVGRHLTERVSAEVNVDYAQSGLELSPSALSDIEATRASFASAWTEQLLMPGTPWVNPAVSSTTEIEEGSGGRIVATGALRVKLRLDGRFVPFVTGGLGGVFTRGQAASVTLKGNYSMTRVGQGGQVPVGTILSFNEADTVTMRFTRPDRAPVGVLGGGFTYDLARGRGLRVDVCAHVRSNAIDTAIGAAPSVRTGTPGAMASFASNTSPTVVISNAGSGASLSGPAFTSFATREGSGWQIDTALAVGYFWRF